MKIGSFAIEGSFGKYYLPFVTLSKESVEQTTAAKTTTIKAYHFALGIIPTSVRPYVSSTVENTKKSWSACLFGPCKAIGSVIGKIASKVKFW